MTKNVTFDTETVLEDDYPVFYSYYYLADGQLIYSDIQGTVADLKRYYKAKEIRRVDVAKRANAIIR